jgi:hypothetical protein
MKKSAGHHLHIWELFRPEGHYMADLALAGMHTDGVVTSKTAGLPTKKSRN